MRIFQKNKYERGKIRIDDDTAWKKLLVTLAPVYLYWSAKWRPTVSVNTTTK